MTTLAERERLWPSWRFMLKHPAHFIALGFGSGLSVIAPGTLGTLVAFPLHAGLELQLDATGELAVIALAFIAGVWACGRTGRALGAADHGAMVWDEIVAFLLVLVFTPREAAWQAGAFVLFRFFDIVKPSPIRYYDRTLKGGFGVMFDDLIAAFYTLFVLAWAKHFFG
ncbi:MAG TPA: phosphatidylglycerophosphatase A [Burkholderiales bacterium]|nr:phosphatidylglycerophosphatase A [Burkholderiales bacterium]